ncbi:MAG: PIN domain nuclease [Anaerolineaceae bacterium]|nr:PIN domain nuclease [Anaerolineaceae bacterium]
MIYLLDTHTFLWFINDDSALSNHARSLIEAPDHTILLSIASLWEMAIKVSLNKLEMPSPFETFVTGQLDLNNIVLLSIQAEHTGLVATLPFHHRDPFDRMIIAQALLTKTPVIGKDENFDLYGIERLW